MTHRTPDGCTIILPDIDIDALVNASCSQFVQEILAKNPALPAVQLTRKNLLCSFMRLTARLSKQGPFPPEIKAQIRIAQQRWISSTAGDSLHEVFDGKPRKIGAQLPPSLSSTADIAHSQSRERENVTASIISIKATEPQTKNAERSATAPGESRRIGSNQRYNPNVIVQMAQFLGEGYRKRLARNGLSLLVSLPSETGSVQRTKTTHAHLADRTQQAGDSLQIQLVTAYSPSIVLVYASKAHKDMAIQQIERLKFQFEDCDSIKLDVQDFTDNLAGAEAKYTLGSGPLYFCDYQESLQRFFCNEGFVSLNDVIQTRRNGLRTEVSIRYRFCPGFMEKLTALPGGHRDHKIPAQSADSCSLCLPTLGKVQIQSSSRHLHVSNERAYSFLNSDGDPIADISSRPVLKIPGPNFVAAYPSVEDVKITTYIKAFTLLNGVKITGSIPPHHFAHAFNRFLDVSYPHSDFEARLAVLHRIEGGDRARDWERLCAELRRHFTVVYMSESIAVNSSRRPLTNDSETARKRPKRTIAADYF